MMRLNLLARTLGVSLMLGACDNATGPTTGAVNFRVSTTGAATDLDPNGYTLSIDGATAIPVTINANLTIGDLAVGEHVIRLDGLVENCAVAGDNPRTINVTAGDDAPAVTVVFFTVTCVPRNGSIRVSTTTTGPDPDPDGYSVTVMGGQRGTVLPNDTREIPGIREGQHSVALSGVSQNCTVDLPHPRGVNVVFGKTVDVAFTIRCVAAARLQITTVTRGVQSDTDGYDLQLGLVGTESTITMRIGSNGTSTVSGLMPGTYRGTISDLSPNCDPAVPNPREVALSPGSTAALLVEVECVAPAQIAFVNQIAGNSEIYVMTSIGTDQKRLTISNGADLNPTWSPDARRIAFTSLRDGNDEIYAMNADGTDPVRLTSNPAADFRPAWSPDGTRIAFVSTRDGNGEIYIMNADGTNPIRLTNHTAFDGSPAWSPDGSRIAFQSNRGSNVEDIYVMNADGSGVVRLTSSLGAVEPAWSPDGTRIAFAALAVSNLREIFVVKADGSALQRLTYLALGAANPSWSPDSRKIAFGIPSDCYYYYYDCGSVIRIVGADGAPYSFSVGPMASDPAWRP